MRSGGFAGGSGWAGSNPATGYQPNAKIPYTISGAPSGFGQIPGIRGGNNPLMSIMQKLGMQQPNPMLEKLKQDSISYNDGSAGRTGMLPGGGR